MPSGSLTLSAAHCGCGPLFGVSVKLQKNLLVPPKHCSVELHCPIFADTGRHNVLPPRIGQNAPDGWAAMKLQTSTARAGLTTTPTASASDTTIAERSFMVPPRKGRDWRADRSRAPAFHGGPYHRTAVRPTEKRAGSNNLLIRLLNA